MNLLARSSISAVSVTERLRGSNMSSFLKILKWKLREYCAHCCLIEGTNKSGRIELQ